VTEDGLGELLGRPVRLVSADLRLGAVAGVYLDERLERVIGLQVSSRDGRARFLPWVASGFDEVGVHVRSALLLLETGELDPYLRRGARLLRTRGELAGLFAAHWGNRQFERPRPYVPMMRAAHVAPRFGNLLPGYCHDPRPRAARAALSARACP